MTHSIIPTQLAERELAIETRDLVKQYGAHRALQKAALQVPEGAVSLLIGPNGAGKSTIIKILIDLVRPSSGDALVLGMNTRTESPLIRANVGYVPEQLDWGYAWMKVGRLLEHHAAYFPAWDAQYARRLSDAFDLRLDQKMSTLSKGQGRRVHLVLALAHRPPVLILDEPTDGLDPVMRDGVLQALISHVADAPTTMLISTHHAGELEQLADHVSVLRAGSLCAQLPIEELKRGLRRYRAEVPDAWTGASEINGAAISKVRTQGQIEWTVWGDERDVVDRLGRSGAQVRDVLPMGINEAALALLNPQMVMR